MNNFCKISVIVFLVAVLSLYSQPANTIGHYSLVNDVYNRLLKSIYPQKGYDWPPAIEIPDDTLIHAGSLTYYNSKHDKFGFKIILSKGLLDKFVGTDEDALAFIISHELGHIDLKHLNSRKKNDNTIMKNVLKQTDEFEADFAGMRIALDAGFSFSGMLKSMKQMVQLGFNSSAFDNLTKEHPSWSDRLSNLDKNHKQLWESISSFQNGVTFLSLEQIEPAIYCFNYVIDQFPDCYEGYVNLGYAKLMKYIDNIEYSDYQYLQTGYFLTGGYYKSSKSLSDRIRGIDRDLWWDAVGYLQTANNFGKDLALAKENLGLAYLVSPFRRRDIGKAYKNLTEAAELAEKDANLDLASKAIIYANAGLSKIFPDTLNENPPSYSKKEINYERAFSEINLQSNNYFSIEIENASKYNKALKYIYDNNPDNENQALSFLEEFLIKTDTNLIWWKIGYNYYSNLCTRLNVEEKKIIPNIKKHYNPIVGISLNNKIITLSDKRDRLLSQLNGQQIEEINVIPGKDLRRYRIEKQGIELLASEYIFAIFLNSSISPSILLSNGDKTDNKLNVGMTINDLEKIMEDSYYMEKVNLVNPNDNYRYYYDRGIGVKFDQTNKFVDEFVIVHKDIE